MQRLLHHAVWDEHEAMGIVRDFAVEHLTDLDAVAVWDQTGQPTKGTPTAGIARQSGGCAGQVTTAVTIGSCTYASSRGHAHVDAPPRPAPRVDHRPRAVCPRRGGEDRVF